MAQLNWVAPTIVASGETWTQFKGDNLKGHFDRLASTNVAKANPTTAATVSVTGGGSSGGLLAAGDYFVAYTFVDAFGETLVGGRSTTFTVSAGNKPRVTFPALPTGVNSINIYLTEAGGASGTEKLYATGISTTTFDLEFAKLTDINPTQPVANTTGSALHYSEIYAFLDKNSAGSKLAKLYATQQNFTSGAPMEQRVISLSNIRAAGIALFWNTVFKEAGTLFAANPGTVSTASAGINHKTIRVMA